MPIIATCPKCGVEIDGSPNRGGMAKHFETVHPEIRFAKYRVKHHTFYKCPDCDVESPGFMQLVNHQNTRLHRLGIRRAAVDRGASVVEVQARAITEPPNMMDKFLENLTATVSEINQLRKENTFLRQERDVLRKQVADSQEKTKRWCNMIVQLQEALAKKG